MNEPFVRLDKDSTPTELRFDCCPNPTPVINPDVDDHKAWEVMCEACDQTLIFLTAPDESETLIAPVVSARRCPACGGRGWRLDLDKPCSCVDKPVGGR